MHTFKLFFFIFPLNLEPSVPRTRPQWPYSLTVKCLECVYPSEWHHTPKHAVSAFVPCLFLGITKRP